MPGGSVVAGGLGSGGLGPLLEPKRKWRPRVSKKRITVTVMKGGVGRNLQVDAMAARKLEVEERSCHRRRQQPAYM